MAESIVYFREPARMSKLLGVQQRGDRVFIYESDGNVNARVCTVLTESGNDLIMYSGFFPFGFASNEETIQSLDESYTYLKRKKEVA